MYETAEESSPRPPCRWTFQKESHYSYDGTAAEEAESYLDNEMIMANYHIDGAIYDYNVVTRNQADYKLNDISAYFRTAGSPMSIDSAIFTAKFCRTPKPNPEDVQRLQSKAEAMLAAMNMGSWAIDHYEIQENQTGETEYIVNFTASPILAGAKTIGAHQFSQLPKSEAYTSVYYMTAITLSYSLNGDLIDFHFASPIDTVTVAEEETEVMDPAALLQRIQEQLSFSEVENYIEPYFIQSTSNLTADIRIRELEYGLARIPAQNKDTYLYVPSILLKASIDVLDGSNLISATDGAVPLIILNATDGSVIDVA